MGNNIDDARLLGAIADGDQRALRALHDRYAPRIARFLYRLTLDPPTVAELVNEVFLVIWQKAPSFRGDAAVSTWIIGIAYRKGLKALKRRKFTEPLDDRMEDPRDRHAGSDLASDLDRALSCLSPEHRAVVELTYNLGYTYRETSEALGCAENTVKTRMFKARRKLRTYLEAGADEY